MPRLTRMLALALQTGCLMFAGWQVAQADPTRPFPEAFPDFEYYYIPTLRQPDGKTLTVGALSKDLPSHAIAVVRTNADGTPDPTFGKGGLVTLTVWGAADYGRAIALQPDGKLVVVGSVHDPSTPIACGLWAYCQWNIAMHRLHADGRHDLTFNGTGRLIFRASALETGLITKAEVQANGMILLIASIGDYPNGVDTVVGRVLANGALDTSFIRSDRNVPLVPITYTVAVNFYNTALDHHFVTADTNEIAGLDRNPATGWRWNGSGFRVEPTGTQLGTTKPVCRFYGNPEVGLNSHVLSVNLAECAALEAAGGAHWILESHEVFRVAAPDPATGACDPDRKPVYRLWNGRQDSGHVLTTEPAFREQLMARGYVPEGWGEMGVAMCVMR